MKKMKKTIKFLYFVITFSFLVCVDLYFSNLIVFNLINGWKLSAKFLNIIYAENTGAAFSIMQDSTGFLAFLSVIALVLIFYYIIKHLEIINLKGLFFFAFLTSGIACNLYERIFFGHVRDFFDLTFVDFPIFNISDIFINIGVIGIIILLLLTKKNVRIL
ncbi:MAG: signal peptidase II [Candidatus Gastranaerophilales bacterium]|nr:signal peptidase II [Candidatus Gastranaerophilales bacterium]